jgi:hypothetical protein
VCTHRWVDASPLSGLTVVSLHARTDEVASAGSIEFSSPSARLQAVAQRDLDPKHTLMSGGPGFYLRST